jgi:hypothetical protein
MRAAEGNDRPFDPDSDASSTARRDLRRLRGYGVALVLGSVGIAVAPLPWVVAVVSMIAYAGFGGMCLARHLRAPRQVAPFAWTTAAVLALACGASFIARGAADALFVSVWICLAPCACAFAIGFGFEWLVGTARRPAGTDRRAVLAVAIGLACVAANGLSIFLPLLLLPLFGLTAISSLRRCRPRTSRLLLATTVGLAVTWFGVAFRVEQSPAFFRGMPTSYSSGQHESWLASHDASDEHFETMVVAGFPLQRVEGHGSGGAHERLPWTKGLDALLANFGLAAAAGLVLALLVPAQALGVCVAFAVGAAVPGGLLAFDRLMWMLD